MFYRLRLRSMAATVMLAGCLPAGITSCKKLVAVPPPDDKLPTRKVFTSLPQATGAVIGMYGAITSSPLFISNAGLSVYPALVADEFTVNNTSDKDLRGFAANDISPDDDIGLGANLWSASYRIIGHANNVLEGLLGSPLPESEKAPLRGEALVIRAWHYFYLCLLFGDVPLITDTDVERNNKLPRSPKEQVIAQVLSDLEEALGLLPDNYRGDGKLRVNKAVARSLLARQALFNQRWEQADYYAGTVINDDRFRLEENLRTVFSTGSREAIWQFTARPEDPFATAAAGVFVPSTPAEQPHFVVTRSLNNAFETGDRRKTDWLGQSASGQPLYYPFKYTQREGFPRREGNVLIRLGEVLLIRAEARARMDRSEEAWQDLNRVRLRAGLPALSGNKQQLIRAVINERRLELMGENGSRWFDLKRTGEIDKVMREEKGSSWQSTDALFPIPASQIRINSNLTQNAGYY
ncbi:RagB/SusD family nutrient uptake outer membrane protein [Pseudoflavitalea sp. G-6-1-2]|uniref:RagB/SusD family nutrient uptake outer membrane protein n=1 Tax=Pseudoflavitalea sp. G-6-1-2 TaxID=2728841 RepID=UPI00146BBE07|nr:RagB/SusD family nutrient uptake outer membrane protein [Pseudoflavitalea sp. G-6-1-2]NML23756.1 RagB/SusD family nutrient uptake outer membrane protein [Pseudoflavitalea sp. G-6-1-2]